MASPATPTPLSRMFATLIDISVTVTIALVVFVWLAVPETARYTPLEPVDLLRWVLYSVVAATFIGGIHEIYGNAVHGTTAGKYAVGIRVAPLCDQPHTKWFRYSMRYIVKLLYVTAAFAAVIVPAVRAFPAQDLSTAADFLLGVRTAFTLTWYQSLAVCLVALAVLYIRLTRSPASPMLHEQVSRTVVYANRLSELPADVPSTSHDTFNDRPGGPAEPTTSTLPDLPPSPIFNHQSSVDSHSTPMI